MITSLNMSSPTSTSSSNEYSPKKNDEKTSYRKISKPLMEKKRRARINSCLLQLKSLVLQAMKKDNSQYSKLEKADILELTVKHLKSVQRLQSSSTNQGQEAVSKYRAGFNECASEVMRYLNDSQGVSDQARGRILSHLASILTPINSIPLQSSQQPILPASLVPPPSQSIPQHAQPQELVQKLQIPSSNYIIQPQKVFHTVIDGNNNGNNGSKIIAPSLIVSRSVNSLDELQKTVASVPTAFQDQVPSSKVQFSCLTNQQTTTPVQFVSSTLQNGQVALVLTPSVNQSLNIYSPQPQKVSDINVIIPNQNVERSRFTNQSDSENRYEKPLTKDNLEHSRFRSHSYSNTGDLSNEDKTFMHQTEPQSLTLKRQEIKNTQQYQIEHRRSPNEVEKVQILNPQPTSTDKYFTQNNLPLNFSKYSRVDQTMSRVEKPSESFQYKSYRDLSLKHESERHPADTDVRQYRTRVDAGYTQSKSYSRSPETDDPMWRPW